MKNEKFSFAKRLASFKFAFKGLRILVQEEHNSWIHIVLATCAVVFGFWLKISLLEWVIVVFAIGFVIVAEIFNSAIENICNFISPERHALIGRIKDLAAAGVLFSAITALIIGLIVFLPKIIALF